MNIISPLSGSSNVSLIENIKTCDLIEIYQKLRIDISADLQNIKKISLYHCDDSDLYFFYPCITGSEKFYEQLQKFNWYYLDDKREYEYASRFIKNFDLVLEVGCGKGAFAKKILSKNFVGLEFSSKASELANGQGLHVLNESIELHVSNNFEKYDVVCAFQVLEHVDKITSFIQSCLDCLKPNGLLIFSVPSFDSFSRYTPNFSLDMPPHHVTRWTDKALNNLEQYFDVEILEIIHEPLQLAHRQMYLQALLRRTLKDIFNFSIKNIDLSLRNSIISLIGKGLTQILDQGLSEAIFSPRGISVLAIYKKR